MSVAALEKDTAELFYFNQTGTSSTGEPQGTWTSEGTFNCAAGGDSGSVAVTGPGKIFPDTRSIITTSTKTFSEGKRILVNGKYWEVIDILPGKSRYGCGATLFYRIRVREVTNI